MDIRKALREGQIVARSVKVDGNLLRSDGTRHTVAEIEARKAKRRAANRRARRSKQRNR